MLVADHDQIAVTDLALKAYARALEPKRLVMVKGGHFDPYLGEFRTASRAAIDSLGIPAGKEHPAWVTNTATFIHGERDVVLVDTFLSEQLTCHPIHVRRKESSYDR